MKKKIYSDRDCSLDRNRQQKKTIDETINYIGTGRAGSNILQIILKADPSKGSPLRHGAGFKVFLTQSNNTIQ